MYGEVAQMVAIPYSKSSPFKPQPCLCFVAVCSLFYLVCLHFYAGTVKFLAVYQSVTFELPFARLLRWLCAMATATGCEANGPSPASLTQQLDEVQLLEAMAGREGEFQWQQDGTGHISGTLQIFLHLEQELEVCIVRRERYI